MRHTLLISVGLAAIVMLTLAPFAVVGYLHRAEIVFDPAAFINDGLDFGLGICSMIIAFLIGNVYWEHKNERERGLRVCSRFLHHLQQVARIIIETSEARARDLQDGDASLQRDQEVLANLRRLGDGNSNALRTLNDSGIEYGQDKKLGVAGSFYRSDVAPALQKLATRPRVRPGSEEIGSDLALVGDNVDRIVKYLGGETHDLGSPGG